jgi:hypothetical protein
VLLRRGDRQRWILFGQTVTRLDTAPGDWSRVGGKRWGKDSPEGGDDSLNALADIEGRVHLD